MSLQAEDGVECDKLCLADNPKAVQGMAAWKMVRVPNMKLGPTIITKHLSFSGGVALIFVLLVSTLMT